MSTSKTQNYQLHSWVPGDKFLRAEMNENFAKLDGASRVSTGSYVGDGQEDRTVALGFTPRLVLVMDQVGWLRQSNDSYGGLAVPGVPALYTYASTGYETVAVVEGGFRVHDKEVVSRLWVRTNSTGRKYCYLAVR